MQTKTYLANAIESADEKAQYDGEAKKITADKGILSWIVKYTVKELKDCTFEEIADAIENVEVAEVPIYPGKKKPGAITGMSTEDKVPGEGEVTYDIRFYIITPKGERIKLILNVEIQKKYYPGYDLVTRAIFYCARMISAQLDTEFTADHYDDIKKVYSIWICLNSPGYTAGTIIKYEITPEILVGKTTGNHRYDLLSVVMIGLNEKSFMTRETPLHGLLGTVFSGELSPEEKLEILNGDYGIEATREVKEGMRQMCNLSDAIEEKGIQEGIQKGIQEGEERVNRLIRLLIEESRSDEIGKAVSDREYQKELFKEYNL